MEKTTNKKTMIGEVHSNKMNKTVVVKVGSIKVHPKYHKRYKVVKKYPAHNELADINVGDKVEITECRPISKTVNWMVTKKV